MLPLGCVDQPVGCVELPLEFVFWSIVSSTTTPSHEQNAVTFLTSGSLGAIMEVDSSARVGWKQGSQSEMGPDNQKEFPINCEAVNPRDAQSAGLSSLLT